MNNIKNMRNVQQSEIAECGLACVLIFINCLSGRDIPLPIFRKKYPASTGGMSLSGMRELAGQFGLKAKAYKANEKADFAMVTPFIAHCKGGHYVVISRIKKGIFYILDPAQGERKLGSREFNDEFAGVLVQISVENNAKLIDVTAQLVTERRLGWVGLLTQLPNAMSSIVAVIVLGGAIESTALLLPIFTKIVVDGFQGDKTGQVPGFQILALAFFVISMTQAALLFLRFLTITKLSAYFNRDWTKKIFSHLLSLPTLYFQRRHVADIVSRLNSIETIQRTIALSFVSSFLDGLMSIAGIGLLATFSIEIAAIALVSFILYVFVRWATYRKSEVLNQQRAVSSAKLMGEIYESVRGINTLKLAGDEGNRLERYMRVKCDGQVLDVKSQSLLSFVKSISSAVFNATRIAMLVAGFYLVRNEALTIGGLMACIAYGEQFIARAPGLVDKMIDIKLLKVQINRLNDITYSEAEVCQADSNLPISRRSALRYPSKRNLDSVTLKMRNIGFRYGEESPWLFRGLNIDLSPNETLVITGQSGCGKSTVAKIMLGLIEPTEGSFCINNVPLRQFGLANYRRLVGGVLQDDQLFSGTILENIAFFDNATDFARAEECARVAQIYDDIEALPMKFDTFLNGSNCGLSGGQRQRLFLARALYKDPLVLLLDEATSHLDLWNRRKICEEVITLMAAKIIITHTDEDGFPGAKTLVLGPSRNNVDINGANGPNRGVVHV